MTTWAKLRQLSLLPILLGGGACVAIVVGVHQLGGPPLAWPVAAGLGGFILGWFVGRLT